MELQALNRWPILMFNTTYKVKGDMGIEINKHCSYIILISRGCQKWEETPIGFPEQLLALSQGKLWESWNLSAKFVVLVMVNSKYFEGTNISRSILSDLWTLQVTSATGLYLKSNKHGASWEHKRFSTRHATGTAHLVSI